MLTKEKIERIKKCPLTEEDRIIRQVLLAEGVIKLDKLDGFREVNLLHIRRNNYLIYDKQTDLVSLKRKGKTNEHIFVNPEGAECVHDYVYSLLCQDYSLNFGRSVPLVQSFCAKRGLHIGKYIENPNIFATIKKHVKKYLLTKET